MTSMMTTSQAEIRFLSAIAEGKGDLCAAVDASKLGGLRNRTGHPLPRATQGGFALPVGITGGIGLAVG